ncbi:MAG: hypothetical protein PVH88_10055 [Ignavibacteria bacterium]|jgi:hypothetical protein
MCLILERTKALLSRNSAEAEEIVYGKSKNASNFTVKCFVFEFNFTTNAITPLILEMKKSKEWVEIILPLYGQKK